MKTTRTLVATAWTLSLAITAQFAAAAPMAINCSGRVSQIISDDSSGTFSANVAAGKLFTPGFASHRLLEVIAARSASDSGSFYAWDGKVVPW